MNLKIAECILQGRVMCINVRQVLKEFIFEKNKMHDNTQLGEDFNYNGFEDKISMSENLWRSQNTE